MYNYGKNKILYNRVFAITIFVILYLYHINHCINTLTMRKYFTSALRRLVGLAVFCLFTYSLSAKYRIDGTLIADTLGFSVPEGTKGEMRKEKIGVNESAEGQEDREKRLRESPKKILDSLDRITEIDQEQMERRTRFARNTQPSVACDKPQMECESTSPFENEALTGYIRQYNTRDHELVVNFNYDNLKAGVYFGSFTQKMDDGTYILVPFRIDVHPATFFEFLADYIERNRVILFQCLLGGLGTLLLETYRQWIGWRFRKQE